MIVREIITKGGPLQEKFILKGYDLKINPLHKMQPGYSIVVTSADSILRRSCK